MYPPFTEKEIDLEGLGNLSEVRKPHHLDFLLCLLPECDGSLGFYRCAYKTGFYIPRHRRGKAEVI